MRSITLLFLISVSLLFAQTPDPASLIQVHTVNTSAELDAITGANPGSLIFNLENNKLYSFKSGGWSAEAKTPKLLEVYDNNSSYSIGTAMQVIQLNTIRINEGGIFSLSSNQVTVSENGLYEIRYGIAGITNYHAFIEGALYVNGTKLTASEVFGGGWYKKNTISRTVFLEINAGDTIEIQAKRDQTWTNASNSLNTIQAGSFLTIKKIK